ncbi:MAG: hypothetical protein VX492_00085 [Candidatus Thermoplasmatota archaeon]|nr:hypothetical protein [Candidatus Thermoplasmatota archaeon]
MAEDTRPLAAIATVSALTASMCCLPSVVWVLFAGSSAIVAANELSNDLYYSWIRYALYAVSLLMMSGGLAIYFRNRGICDLDDFRRERKRVMNTSLALFTVTVVGYLIWNFVILEIIGIAIGLPWEDSAFWK